MTQRLDYDFLRSYLINLAMTVMKKRDQLNGLDADCGDGDFGIGIYLGFENVQNAVQQESKRDIGALLEGSGQVILSSVGGASGPLFGVLLTEMGKAVRGKTEVTLDDLVDMFGKSLEKVCLLGRAKVGDKTLVDALEPTVKSLRLSARDKLEISAALEAAAQAARLGCESTKELVAKHGKARYLGEQTLGHVDPGAYVIQVMLETLLASYKSQDYHQQAGPK
jgi:dihydroxyacetone kinase-like protein